MLFFEREDTEVFEAGRNKLFARNAYSPCCSPYISWCAGKENLFNNQEVLQLIIISFILMTLILDLGMILKGEIRY